MKKFLIAGVTILFLFSAHDLFGCQVFESNGQFINGCEGVTYESHSFLERTQADYRELEREYGAPIVWVGMILILGIFLYLIKLIMAVVINFYNWRFKR